MVVSSPIVRFEDWNLFWVNFFPSGFMVGYDVSSHMR